MSYHINIEDWQVSFSATAQETLLQAGLRQDIALPHDCESGYCGQCKARIYSGTVHYPQGLAMQTGINAEERAQGLALLCQAYAQSDVTVRFTANQAKQDVPQKPSKTAPINVDSYPAKILSLTKLSPDVTGLSVRLPQTPPFCFQAGQYGELQFLIQQPDHSPPLKRVYSIASAPHVALAEKRLDFHIRHHAGGYFATILPQLQVGGLLRIFGPSGSFHWQALSAKTMLIAGGTGFAPIHALLEDLCYRSQMDKSLISAPLSLYWGVRSAEEVYAPQILMDWAKKLPQLRIHLIPSEDDRPPQHPLLKLWWRKKQFAHLAALADYYPTDDARVYVCGAPAMVNATYQDFQAKGLPAEYFHSDSFVIANKDKLHRD